MLKLNVIKNKDIQVSEKKLKFVMPRFDRSKSPISTPLSNSVVSPITLDVIRSLTEANGELNRKTDNQILKEHALNVKKQNTEIKKKPFNPIPITQSQPKSK